MLKYILVFSLLLTGCGGNNDNEPYKPYRPDRQKDAYGNPKTDDGTSITTAILPDGTKCAVIDPPGDAGAAIDCYYVPKNLNER